MREDEIFGETEEEREEREKEARERWEPPVERQTHEKIREEDADVADA